jgi:hypothetical protein
VNGVAHGERMRSIKGRDGTYYEGAMRKGTLWNENAGGMTMYNSGSGDNHISTTHGVLSPHPNSRNHGNHVNSSLHTKLPARILYPNGACYRGSVVDGRVHGFGRLDFAGGGFYEGEFVQGEKHGFGELMDANGNWWQGRFVHGRFVDGELGGEGSNGSNGGLMGFGNGGRFAVIEVDE